MQLESTIVFPVLDIDSIVTQPYACIYAPSMTGKGNEMSTNVYGFGSQPERTVIKSGRSVSGLEKYNG